MSFVAPRTWADGDTPTPAQLNEVRDSLLASEAAVVTSSGDLIAGTGAKAVARFAAGTTAQVLGVTSTGLQWVSPPSTVTGPGPGWSVLADTSITAEASSADTNWGSAVSLSTYYGAAQSVLVTVTGYVASTGTATDKTVWVDMKLTTTTGTVHRGGTEFAVSSSGKELTVAQSHLFAGYQLAAGSNLQIMCGADSTDATFKTGRVSTWSIL